MKAMSKVMAASLRLEAMGTSSHGRGRPGRPAPGGAVARRECITVVLLEHAPGASVPLSALCAPRRERGALATIACYQRDVKIDLGVIEVGVDNWVENYIEKPTYHYAVSMGIYLFEPEILKYIVPYQHLDLPELVIKLMNDGQRVNVFNFDGYWLDIGRHDDYEKAIEEFSSHQADFLPEA